MCPCTLRSHKRREESQAKNPPFSSSLAPPPLPVLDGKTFAVGRPSFLVGLGRSVVVVFWQEKKKSESPP